MKLTNARSHFFDTNVLLYAYSDDPRRQVAEDLISGGGTIGVQQLNEFVSVAQRKLRRSWREILTAIDDIQILCPDPIPITVETQKAALRLCQRYRYGIYDSLVIAAALASSCDILYSEDLRDGQQIEALTIRNPFRA
jgi:predicted nucleic acid-binding protein